MKKVAKFHGKRAILEIQDNYTPDTRLFWRFCVESNLPFSADSLAEWLEYLREEGMSGSTINRRFFAIQNRLYRMLDLKEYDCEDDRLLTRYKLQLRLQEVKKKQRVRKVSKTVPASKFFTEEEVRAMIAGSTRRTGLIIEFLYMTGVRRDELVNIRKRNIKMVDSNLYQIRIIGKGSKERYVYINTGLRRRIEDAFHGESYLFETKSHNKLQTSYLYKIVSDVGGKVLERQISPHCLRHSRSAQLYHDTGNIKAVSDLMGHKDINTTLGEYFQMPLTREMLGKGLWGDRGRAQKTA